MEDCSGMMRELGSLATFQARRPYVMHAASTRSAIMGIAILGFVIAGQLTGSKAAGSSETSRAKVPPAKAEARDCWLKTPTVSIMVGFIYEPGRPYTIQRWMENLGNRFDADQWVRDFKETGATHLVFYDKWIDGLVFHDTKTTNFKTRRDFVREVAAACRKQKLRLLLYFNAVNDGNPEFDEWTLDKEGKPIIRSGKWPTRWQTLHSPFREKCLEQVRELLGYPIDGIWHDIFSERVDRTNPWMTKAYEKMFGEPFEQATPRRLEEFNARTLAGYLDDVYAMRRERKLDGLIFTSNGSAAQFLNSGIWTDLVGPRLHYLFREGHSFENNDKLARMAWVLPKPVEINLLLNSSWFTPLDDTPPPARWTEKQALAASAVVVCQGAGIHWALTPGHDGTFGDDLKHAKLVGAWFRKVKPALENAQPYADVGIVLGTPASGGPGLPASNQLWAANQGRTQGAWERVLAISDALARQGVFSRYLFMNSQGGSWPATLKAFKAIVVPELAVLDEAHLGQLRQYVREGGKLVAFGHATVLDAKSQRRQDYGLGDVLGARLVGEVGEGGASQMTASVPLKIVDSTAAGIFDNVTIAPRAVRVEPVGAKVVAFLQNEPQAAAILKNTFGRGEAWLITAGDASFAEKSPLWAGLVRLMGGPTVTVEPTDASRYRIILTRVAGGQALHLIDKAVSDGGHALQPVNERVKRDYTAQQVTITLDAKRLGTPRKARLIGSNEVVAVSAKDGKITFSIKPDPVASVMLK